MNIIPCGGDERFAVQELLYFGTEVCPVMSRLKRGRNSREIVTPRFPRGSVWQASGQWRSASGEVIREPYVVSCPPG